MISTKPPFHFRAALAALILLLPLSSQAAHLSVVVDGLNPGHQKVIDSLERSLGAGNRIKIHNIRAIDLSNPLSKGRFLSQVSAADLVIPIGDPASRFVSEELDDLKTFFIAAGSLSGEYLSNRQVSGVLSYSPEETVRVAKALLPELKTIGILYTPGYESVTVRMKSAAAGLSLGVTAQKVRSRQEVGPMARDVLDRSDLLWIVGDPLLTQDLIFAYLLQETLRFKKPLAAPLPASVKKGGFFCTVPDNDKMAGLATDALARLLAAGAPPSAERERLSPAPASGFVLVNHQLMDKWNLHVPSSLRLWEERVP